MNELTNKGKEQILKQQMQASFPYLIKIDWRNGTVSRFINADNDIQYEEYDENTDTVSLETYEAYTFGLILPESSDKGYGSGTLNLSSLNDNTNIIGLIRSLPIGHRPIIEIKGLIIYSEDVSDEPEIETIYDRMYYLSNPSWGEGTDIRFVVKPDEGMDVQMPCDTMNEMTCAGVL